MKVLSQTRGVDALALLMAWIFWALDSVVAAWASWIGVWLGCVPSILSLWKIKSTQQASMYVDLWTHFVYTSVPRQWMWHHPPCVYSMWVLVVAEVDVGDIILSDDLINCSLIVECISHCGKLFATNVVLLLSSDGLPSSFLLMGLTLSFVGVEDEYVCGKFHSCLLGC